MLANSGAGLVVAEMTDVERYGRISHGCLGLYSDACEAALERVVAHCHRIGTAKVAVQLAHAGRKGSARMPWEGRELGTAAPDPWPTMAPSAIPFGADWATPRAMTLEDIERIREAFAAAARRAVRAGSGAITAEAQRAPTPGFNVPFAEQVKRETGIATRTVGLIATPKQAEAIVAEGKADMVALARAMLDDPHWGWRAAHVLGAEVARPKQYQRAAPKVWAGAAFRD